MKQIYWSILTSERITKVGRHTFGFFGMQSPEALE